MLIAAGIAQSFVDTHHPPSPKEPVKSEQREMQQSPDFCCPCGGFLGWKQIRLGGKSLSRSYGDLRNIGNKQAKGWAWEETESGRELKPPKAEPVVVEQPRTPPGTSALEKLPPEVLGMNPIYLEIEDKCGLTNDYQIKLSRTWPWIYHPMVIRLVMST